MSVITVALNFLLLMCVQSIPKRNQSKASSSLEEGSVWSLYTEKVNELFCYSHCGG